MESLLLVCWLLSLPILLELPMRSLVRILWWYTAYACPPSLALNTHLSIFLSATATY